MGFSTSLAGPQNGHVGITASLCGSSVVCVPAWSKVIVCEWNHIKMSCWQYYRGCKQWVACSFLSRLQNLLHVLKQLWFRSRGFVRGNPVAFPAPCPQWLLPRVLSCETPASAQLALPGNRAPSASLAVSSGALAMTSSFSTRFSAFASSLMNAFPGRYTVCRYWTPSKKKRVYIHIYYIYIKLQNHMSF